MLSISNISRHSFIATYFTNQIKTKVHWAKAKKKTSAKYKALNHFDEFYGSVFGNKWKPMREALLRKSKYVAVVNNYGNPEETMEFLSNRGAHCLKQLISIQSKFHQEYTAEKPKETNSSDNTSDKIEQYVEKLNIEAIEKIYPQGKPAPEKLDFSEDNVHEVKKVKDIEAPRKTLEESLSEAVIDETRIIDPAMGLTSEALYQYIPATKLKGMEDWISESVHYNFMTKDKDFPLLIEPETKLEYPEHLKVYTYEMDSEMVSFSEPRRCNTGVFNYYPMDGGSVVTVLGLGLKPGDRVLDMCAAPGGKSLVALQTLLPDVIVCNDVSISRGNRMRRIFKDYFFDFETSNKWRERVIFKTVDGRLFVDDEGFDKILVDVPCTTDRHSVMEDENNIFRPDRIRERLKIQDTQSQLLLNALRLVKVGGSIVYSTCSLSPIQNDGVVHAALKLAFESYNIVATVKDLTQAFSGLSSTLELGSGKSSPKYGQLIVPSLAANFGPTYIAKLDRVK